jgi:hypothetical protein
MDEDNNERLAKVYDPKYPQLIILFPYAWKHHPNGNWFLNWTFSPEDLQSENNLKIIK